MVKRIFLLFCFTLLFNFSFHCAENEPVAPEPPEIQLETVIKSGPEEGAILPHNSTVTFSWDGTIRPGEIIAFSYTFEEILSDSSFRFISGDEGMIRSFNKSKLDTGQFRFSVRAYAWNGDSICTDYTPAIRNFSVVADSLAPQISLLSGPEDGSYIAIGNSVFFEWTASDPSPGGEIVSYSFTLADSSADESILDWSEPRLETTQIAYYKLQEGVYRFWLKATDVSGLFTIVSRIFTVRPLILFVIDQGLTAYDVDFWHQHVLKDIAYEDFYLTSDPADFLNKLNPIMYPSIIWAGNDGTSILPGSEFVDITVEGSLAEGLDHYVNDGGHLWISGSEILFTLGNDIWPPMVYQGNSFVREVLHIIYSDESSDNFQGGQSTGIGNYNNIFTEGGVTFDWCDRVEPVPGEAETILTFVSQDTNFMDQSVAIRYPAGVDDPGSTHIIYCGFYIADLSNPGNPKTLNPTDIYQFATTVFTAFGENLD